MICAAHLSPYSLNFRWHTIAWWPHEWAVIQRDSAGVPWRWVDWCVWWHWLGCDRCPSGLHQAGLQPGSCVNMEYQVVFKIDVCSEMCGEWVFFAGLPTPNHKLQFLLHSCQCWVLELWVHTRVVITQVHKLVVAVLYQIYFTHTHPQPH